MATSSNLHLFEKENDQYVFSASTGLILECDDGVQRVIEEPEKHKKSDVYKYLFDTPKKMKLPPAFQQDRSKLKMITMFLTNQCNLNCGYCFEKQNSVEKAKKMTTETFRQAIDYFVKYFNYDNQRQPDSSPMADGTPAKIPRYGFAA